MALLFTAKLKKLSTAPVLCLTAEPALKSVTDSLPEPIDY